MEALLLNISCPSFADFFDQSKAMESIWCENCDENCENKQEGCNRKGF